MGAVVLVAFWYLCSIACWSMTLLNESFELYNPIDTCGKKWTKLEPKLITKKYGRLLTTHFIAEMTLETNGFIFALSIVGFDSRNLSTNLILRWASESLSIVDIGTTRKRLLSVDMLAIGFQKILR
jgi:hypothetical protein